MQVRRKPATVFICGIISAATFYLLIGKEEDISLTIAAGIGSAMGLGLYYYLNTFKRKG